MTLNCKHFELEVTVRFLSSSLQQSIVYMSCKFKDKLKIGIQVP